MAGGYMIPKNGRHRPAKAATKPGSVSPVKGKPVSSRTAPSMPLPADFRTLEKMADFRQAGHSDEHASQIDRYVGSALRSFLIHGEVLERHPIFAEMIGAATTNNVPPVEIPRQPERRPPVEGISILTEFDPWHASTRYRPSIKGEIDRDPVNGKIDVVDWIEANCNGDQS